MVNRAIPPGAGAVESGARADLDAIYAALSDPTRRAILAQLLGGAAVVGDLEAGAALSPAAISKHLKVLERAGLISRSRDAQRRPCRVEAPPVAEASAWLDGYRESLEATFQRLDALLHELQTKPKKRKRTKR